MYFFFILCSFCFNFVWWHCYYCNKPVSSTLMILWRCQYEDEFAKPGKPELMHWWLLRDYQSTKTIAFVYCTPLVCLCSLYLSISVTHKHVPNLITQNTWKYSVSNKKCAAIDECIWNKYRRTMRTAYPEYPVQATTTTKIMLVKLDHRESSITVPTLYNTSRTSHLVVLGGLETSIACGPPESTPPCHENSWLLNIVRCSWMRYKRFCYWKLPCPCVWLARHVCAFRQQLLGLRWLMSGSECAARWPLFD